MAWPGRVTLLALMGIALAGCAPSGSGPAGAPNSQPPPAQPGRTLIMAVRSEPNTFAFRPILAGGFSGNSLAPSLFSADLTFVDENGNILPRLAEALPKLNTDTWRVSPDGTMETTWRLKPGVTWHDGTALTTEDFVFAWHAYSVPDFVGGSALMRAIGDITPTDDRTLVIHYKLPLPRAGELSGSDGLPPLPRHLLEQPLQQLDPNSFANLPFWTRDYVGLGPYRVDGWDPGASFQGVAFDQYFLGRAKIGRIKVLLIGDQNTALANLLAGELDMTGTDNTIGFEQADTLKREWESSGAGVVYLGSNLWRSTAFQLRPEYANPHAILDVRVRQALASSVDKQLLNDKVWRGLMVISDVFIRPTSKWAPYFESSVVKYPYDLRRTEQLMNDAGFVKGADGIYVSPQERFKAELKTAQSAEWVAEMTIMADAWRKLGFDMQDAVVPPAATNDPPTRTTFPALFTQSAVEGEAAVDTYITAQIPRIENNFRNGQNRGGWSNPEYDRLQEAFGKTLEPGERGKLVAQMAKLYTEDLPIIPLLFVQQPGARIAALQRVLATTPEGQIFSNVHEWEFR